VFRRMLCFLCVLVSDAQVSRVSSPPLAVPSLSALVAMLVDATSAAPTAVAPVVGVERRFSAVPAVVGCLVPEVPLLFRAPIRAAATALHWFGGAALVLAFRAAFFRSLWAALSPPSPLSGIDVLVCVTGTLVAVVTSLLVVPRLRCPVSLLTPSPFVCGVAARLVFLVAVRQLELQLRYLLSMERALLL
jgi:hypothetical protein